MIYSHTRHMLILSQYRNSTFPIFVEKMEQKSIRGNAMLPRGPIYVSISVDLLQTTVLRCVVIFLETFYTSGYLRDYGVNHSVHST